MSVNIYKLKKEDLVKIIEDSNEEKIELERQLRVKGKRIDDYACENDGLKIVNKILKAKLDYWITDFTEQKIAHINVCVGSDLGLMEG